MHYFDKIVTGFSQATGFLFSLQRAVIYIFLCAFVMPYNTAEASTDRNITIQWRANPPEENVKSYRLYYGSQSRFDSNGNLKSDFSYDYYIDLADSLRCNNQESDAPCEYLYPDELSCDNIYDTNPNCTLTNLDGTLYFSITACTDSLESGFTHEIKSIFVEDSSPDDPPTGGPSTSAAAISQIVSQILLRKN